MPVGIPGNYTACLLYHIRAIPVHLRTNLKENKRISWSSQLLQYITCLAGEAYYGSIEVSKVHLCLELGMNTITTAIFSKVDVFLSRLNFNQFGLIIVAEHGHFIPGVSSKFQGRPNCTLQLPWQVLPCRMVVTRFVHKISECVDLNNSMAWRVLTVQ